MSVVKCANGINIHIDAVQKGVRPLADTEKGLLVYRKGKLLLWEEGKEAKQIFQWKQSGLKGKLGNIRLFDRIFRSEPRTCVVKGSEAWISKSKYIYHVHLDTGVCEQEHRFRNGMAQPGGMSLIESVPGFDDCVAYGEYFDNPAKDEVCVYSRNFTTTKGEWQKRFAFDKGQVRHIHRLIPDVKKSCVYILTGDIDRESGIWIATDNFEHVEPVLVGSQEYRSCVALVIGDNQILFATDIPERLNHLKLLDVENKTTIDLLELPGTCLSGVHIGNYQLVSTAVETAEPKDRSKKERIKYMVRRRLADGMRGREACLYIGNVDTGFQVAYKLKKDFWPAGIAQIGKFGIVSSLKPNTAYCYPIALKKYDGTLLKITIEG